MASARLIRSASHRRVRIATDPERESLLSTADRVFSGASDITEEDTPFAPYAFSDLPVYQNIWRIRKDIMSCINDPYSLDQLRGPRLTQTIIRPLLNTYYEMDDVSIIFCLLVNRLQFIKDQKFPIHHQSVSTTRALVCEVLASRLLRQFDEDSSGPNGLLLLANIVIAGFDPFQGSPIGMTKINTRLNWITQPRGYERQVTALEVAILSESKLFLSHSACQKVVDAIYTGRIVYSPTAFFDIIPDHYKHKPISIYDPKRAPLLNQYRLSVPRIRNMIEVGQFVLLLALYFWVMTTKDAARFSTEELLFCIYTSGWVLEQVASILEHGWQVYSQNLWSFLDITFIGIYLFYFSIRMHGLAHDEVASGQLGLDLLAMAAPFLIPRLAFNLYSENLVFVSLRDMMSRFILLMLLAVWCFAGFFLAMWWLSDRVANPLTIGKWMIWVWFGLDGTGIARSVEFHQVLGPILFISFAILGNTLFLTILVSTLSSTYARITAHSVAEIQFRKAVLTFEGVKSDALFAFPPPFNMVALVTMLPLKLFLSQRWFHKVNITIVRILNAPLLIFIGFYERRNLWPIHKEALNFHHYKNKLTTSWNLFHAHADIQEVFENPPDEDEDLMYDEPDLRRAQDEQPSSPATERLRDIGERIRSISISLPSRPARDQKSRMPSNSRNRRGSSSLPDSERTMERRLSRIEGLLSQISDTIDDSDQT